MDETAHPTLTVYGTRVCPMVPPVRALLKSANVTYDYVDIGQDDDAKAVVREINNGNESVPTLVFSDGTTMTEPSTRMLRAELESRGYEVANRSPLGQVLSWLRGSTSLLVGGALLVFGAFNGDWGSSSIGVTLLAACGLARGFDSNA